MKVSTMKSRYRSNKEKTLYSECTCPSCGTVFQKERRNQVFCRTKGGTICKDKYWNTVDPKKRNNTTRISPASRKYLERKRSYKEFEDDHPFSSEALGQW